MESRTGSAAAAQPVITVQGSAVLSRTPELATARVVVECDGEDRGEVIDRTTTTHATLSAGLGSPAAPVSGVVRWSAPQMRVWEARPWSQDGEQLPLVHHASATLDVVFDDRTVLSRWLSRIAGTAGVTVQQLEWTLTDASRIAAETEALTAAVADARRRAEAIAAALGLTSVHAVAVSDPGLLPQGDAPVVSAMAMDAAAPRFLKAPATPASGEGLALEPDEIRVEVAVHARFTAA